MADQRYPVFKDPVGYMKCRVPRGPTGRIKSWSECRAIYRCLSATEGIDTVLDLPCGPGRLFPYWSRRGFKVHGMDFSQPMVQAANDLHGKMKLTGSVSHGDAFQLVDTPEVELVASVRFAYYFDSSRRVDLFRSLAGATKKYVLTQFKTAATFKGKRNHARELAKRGNKHFATHAQILNELREAGLVPLRIEPIGEFSDRAFVIARRADLSPDVPAPIISPAPGRLMGAIARLFTGDSRPVTE